MTRRTAARSVTDSAVMAVLLLLIASTGYAQTNGQVWTNLTYDWLRTERLTYELDLEPKSQVVAAPGQPQWVNLDITPAVAYTVTGWLDLVGELTTGYTNQSDDLNAFEMTERVGLQWSILSRLIRPHVAAQRGVDLEKEPRRRMVISALARIEHRSFVYSGNTPTESSWRFRHRIEFDYPFNRPKLTMDGVVYLTTDGEAFMSLGSGRVDQFRIRPGIGYRRSFAWRFEALYILTRNRNADADGFSVSGHAFDVRIKRIF